MNTKADVSVQLTKRRRGRPTENSRQKVLATARNLLAKKPDTPLTMASVAKELDLVSMALYKHVRNKDDLLEGVAELVFSECQPSLPEKGTWKERLESWSYQLREFFHAHPYVITLMGWEQHMSKAGLELTYSLIELFQSQGLDGEELAINVQWYMRTVIAYFLLELSETPGEGSTVWIENSSLDSLDESTRDSLSPILSRLSKRTADDEFAYFLERTLASLELLVED